MKYCEDYAALLDPYIDGELPPEDAARVREHLTVCAGCRAYVRGGAAAAGEFPGDRGHRGARRLCRIRHGRIRSGAAPQKKRPDPRWAKVLLPLAACCAIVVLVRSLPAGVTTADTASAGAVTEEAVQDDAAVARSSPPETEESAEVSEDASAAEPDTAIPETDTKSDLTVGTRRPHIYTAANGQEDGAGTDAVQPETQSEKRRCRRDHHRPGPLLVRHADPDAGGGGHGSGCAAG